MGASFQKPAGFEEDDIKLLSYYGAEVTMVRHTTAKFIGSHTPLTAIFHIHGGGLATGTSRVLGGVLATLSRDCGMPVFTYEIPPSFGIQSTGTLGGLLCWPQVFARARLGAQHQSGRDCGYGGERRRWARRGLDAACARLCTEAVCCSANTYIPQA